MASPVVSLDRRPLDPGSVVSGVLVALLVNGLLLGLAWYTRSRAGRPPEGAMTFVDAKLVRFGKPRDLSFLPHVQATPKVNTSKKVLKLTEDPMQKALLKAEKEEQDEKQIAKITEQFKNLREDPDDRATREATEEGSLTGTRGGTAAEASGDPYIQEIMAAVTERWTVPTMLTPGELARLHASACLKIDDDGRLVEFRITERSGNDLFDGSLDATLGSISILPKPHGRYANAARRGNLCPIFMKQ